ncbi:MULTISPECIES: vitamin K epoxide reductase family protein [Cyanophyceae]|uniref:vitamin K epoxide reductase family protein n=1 Tax=Cyanophyceae TaxID=3028117 RepID=UPI001688F88E|nr:MULTISPECIES: vitamin K epoxide reductase family protein [Cyanophyceae]MBD1915237.1 vitamin K epoxide reductase family protein [Phormidium sp. FACHB-77]MBD2032486.1 vitamin K epoxide reductase family protein [Phormidium sp. FACHB-322]MBD2050983.1 vitamin K epoxide reductase family protein [Leptolyngbya sp. FACHB-60]
MNPTQLSNELRNGSSPDLERRRQIIGLSMLGAAIGEVITLYQTGVVKELPSLPGSFFDANKVDASEYAYSRFNSPDGPLMTINYGITAWLASMGGENRGREQPLIPVAMGAKLLFDALLTTELAREEWAENEALCEYCQVATLATFASLAIAIPEITTAVQTLMGKTD